MPTTMTIGTHDDHDRSDRSAPRPSWSSLEDKRRQQVQALPRRRRRGFLKITMKKVSSSRDRIVRFILATALTMSTFIPFTLFHHLTQVHNANRDYTELPALPLRRGIGKENSAMNATTNSAPAMTFDTAGHPKFPPAFPIVRTRGTPQQPQLSKEAIGMCTRTLWHTLETTTIVLPNNETFIHTGDIDDLWLRDSAAQIHPLLVPMLSNKEDSSSLSSLLQHDKKLQRIVSGLIRRTATYIRHDPYANAFRIDDSYVFNEEQKRLGRHDLISTWNYELDSGCFYMRLLYYFWKSSDSSTNDYHNVLLLPSVQEAVDIMVDVYRAEQRHELDDFPSGPLLDCRNCGRPHRYPTLPRNGKGTPTNSSSGLTWTAFRPSDDECQYGFLVPSNMFAVVVLEYMVEMARELWKNEALATKAETLADEIQRGIEEHAIVRHPKFGMIYAYEVDGLGNSLFMDDANVPSLMSIPYLGYDKYDPVVYANTRRFILSRSNPTYQKGTNKYTGEIEGYGSPHMKKRIPKNIWPMSLAIQGLTSDSVDEKVRLVESLVKASAGTHWMHESFDVGNPYRYTRAWFCWSDSLFAELVMSLTDECPQPSYKYHVSEWRDSMYVRGGPYSAEDDTNGAVVQSAT